MAQRLEEIFCLHVRCDVAEVIFIGQVQNVKVWPWDQQLNWLMSLLNDNANQKILKFPTDMLYEKQKSKLYLRCLSIYGETDVQAVVSGLM